MSSRRSAMGVALLVCAACTSDGGAAPDDSIAAGSGIGATASTPGSVTGGASGTRNGTTSSGGTRSSSSSGGTQPFSGGTTSTGGAGIAGVTGNTSSSGATSSGATSSGGATGAAGTSGTSDPPPRRINVMPGPNFSTSFNGQPMSLNKTKPIMGKLVVFLGGIGGGPGSGGIDAFVHQYGFHIFMPRTQTSLTGSSVPAMYKTMLTDDDPSNDAEANRQVGDARTDLWDGKGRVTWNTVAPGTSILEETIGAIEHGMMVDPGGDWGFFLDADGTLRTTDVWVVGYSWGSQTWAMVASYIRFGRVVCTSGPVDEGWPNASWMSVTSATLYDRKYALVGQMQPWPMEMETIFANVVKAGWPGSVVNVLPTDTMRTYSSDQHLFAMIGGNGGITPGGHAVFCNDNPANGWIPLCKHVFGQD